MTESTNPGAGSESPPAAGSAIFGDSLSVLNGLLAPIPEDRKRRLAAFARECIINSGGDPDATPNAVLSGNGKQKGNQ
jgi:hypothetical protein